MQHLYDGDAASNTLGWRWVAGVQTQGKHYLASEWNIKKFTNNRFNNIKLNENAPPKVSEKTYSIVKQNFANPRGLAKFCFTIEYVFSETFGGAFSFNLILLNLLLVNFLIFHSLAK